MIDLTGEDEEEQSPPGKGRGLPTGTQSIALQASLDLGSQLARFWRSCCKPSNQPLSHVYALYHPGSSRSNVSCSCDSLSAEHCLLTRHPCAGTTAAAVTAAQTQAKRRRVQQQAQPPSESESESSSDSDDEDLGAKYRQLVSAATAAAKSAQQTSQTCSHGQQQSAAASVPAHSRSGTSSAPLTAGHAKSTVPQRKGAAAAAAKVPAVDKTVAGAPGNAGGLGKRAAGPVATSGAGNVSRLAKGGCLQPGNARAASAGGRPGPSRQVQHPKGQQNLTALPDLWDDEVLTDVEGEPACFSNDAAAGGQGAGTSGSCQEHTAAARNARAGAAAVAKGSGGPGSSGIARLAGAAMGHGKTPPAAAQAAAAAWKAQDTMAVDDEFGAEVTAAGGAPFGIVAASLAPAAAAAPAAAGAASRAVAGSSCAEAALEIYLASQLGHNAAAPAAVADTRAAVAGGGGGGGGGDGVQADGVRAVGGSGRNAEGSLVSGSQLTTGSAGTASLHAAAGDVEDDSDWEGAAPSGRGAGGRGRGRGRGRGGGSGRGAGRGEAAATREEAKLAKEEEKRRKKEEKVRDKQEKEQQAAVEKVRQSGGGGGGGGGTAHLSYGCSRAWAYS